MCLASRAYLVDLGTADMAKAAGFQSSSGSQSTQASTPVAHNLREEKKKNHFRYECPRLFDTNIWCHEMIHPDRGTKAAQAIFMSGWNFSGFRNRCVPRWYIAIAMLVLKWVLVVPPWGQAAPQ